MTTPASTSPSALRHERFSNDLALTFDDRGSGPAVLVLHGGGGPFTVARFVEAMSAHSRVIAPVHPGFAGMPRPDGTVNPEQRPEADVNIEFRGTSKFADQSMRLAFLFRVANEKYASDYPAAVGNHMTNTDSDPFMDLVPAISLRENERGMQLGAGWNPNYHQASDLYATYSDKDFRLGLNAAQTTLGAVAELTGAQLK